MQSESVNLLFIADVVGRPGKDRVESLLPELIREHTIHLVIMNGENAASGKGLTAGLTREFHDMGVNVITSGNHIWDKQNFISTLESDPHVLRPLNYPSGAPGRGSCIAETTDHHLVGVINVQGRSFMYPIDCPFMAADAEIKRLQNQGVRIILVDFHAEATAEKQALAWYLDGKASAVIGTHTHVQTADERILEQGTAYITDAGMTGPYDSVIGMDRQTAIRRFVTHLPAYYKMAAEDPWFCGVVVSVNPASGRACAIKRLQIQSRNR